MWIKIKDDRINFDNVMTYGIDRHENDPATVEYPENTVELFLISNFAGIKTFVLPLQEAEEIVLQLDDLLCVGMDAYENEFEKL